MKLKINNRKITGISPTLGNKKAHINNPLVKEEISREGKKYIRENKNENMSYQNLWDIAKAVLSGRSLPLKTSIRKVERYKISNIFNLSYKKENFNQSKQKERQ